MNLKNVFMIFYLIISGFYFANFQASLPVWCTFFFNFLIISFVVYYHLYLEKVFSPFLSTFIVFNYIFFIAAPISQINEMLSLDNPIFINNFPYKPDLIIKTNLIIIFFNIVFFLTYDYLKKRKLNLNQSKRRIRKAKNLPVALILMVIIGIAIVIFNIDYISYEYNRPEWMESTYTKSISLIKNKVLFIFPLGAIIGCNWYLRSNNKNVNNIYIIIACLVIFFSLLVILKNPFITKRHDLGPIMFILIFLFVPKLINSNAKFLNILYFAVVIGLPISQLLTHSDYGIQELIAKPSRILDQVDQGILTEGYLSLNYDAFINIGIVLEVVKENGFSYGFQLLSALLFFVPRTLWSGKPNSSGTVVGEHLTDNYEFYFQNVSNPFVSESYHNFGIFGVFIFSIGIAYFCVKMLFWLHSNDRYKQAISFFFALHLIFIFRGDITSSFAYLVATFVGIYFLPVWIISFFNYQIKSNQNT